MFTCDIIEAAKKILRHETFLGHVIALLFCREPRRAGRFHWKPDENTVLLLLLMKADGYWVVFACRETINKGVVYFPIIFNNTFFFSLFVSETFIDVATMWGGVR